MQVQNLYQPFEIECIQTNGCPVKPHKHTFFELVFILEGEGTFHINNNTFTFTANNLFLLMPMDINYCEVNGTTSFLFIRFNNIFLKAQEPKEQYSNLGEWVQKLEYIFQNKNPLSGCIIRNVHDKPLVRSLVEAIMQEYINQRTLQKELIQQLVNTLITVVARNISLHVAEKTNISSNVSLDIIHYIHQNIYNPEKLKAENIAAHFNISFNYISEYFKKHTDSSLQQYITNYRLSLIEIRLMHSNMRVNEIASELGFVDESHLTKTFKKYKGLSPIEFKRKMIAMAS